MRLEPARWEVPLVLALAAGNLAAEWAGHKTVFVVSAALLVAGFALWSERRAPGTWATWGLRRDNLRGCLPPIALITAAGAAVCLAVGAAAGRLPPPHGFWLVLLLYPAWGVAQQLLLNGLLARNLSRALPAALAVPLGAAAFALAHLPDLPVAALTLPAGAAWVWAYRRWPNLWLLGLGHGVVGAMAFYLVLGRQPL